jgi:hypothetical protein
MFLEKRHNPELLINPVAAEIIDWQSRLVFRPRLNERTLSVSCVMQAHVTKDRYIKAYDPAVLAAMKRMETTLDAMKLCAPTVHQIN